MTDVDNRDRTHAIALEIAAKRVPQLRRSYSSADIGKYAASIINAMNAALDNTGKGGA